MITLSDLLVNPSGKGTATFFSRAMIKDLMHDIMIKKVHFKPQASSGVWNDFLYLHIKVSSSHYENLLYDVVIAFKIGEDLPLLDREMLVFSNSPGFQFTYAYVLNEMNSLIPQLTNKCLPKALTDAPVVRNPDHVIGFEKSILFAILWLKHHNILNFDTLLKGIGSNKLDIKLLQQSVKTAGQIKSEYDTHKQVAAIKAKANKAKIKEQKSQEKDKILGGFSITKAKTNTSKLSKMSRMVKKAKLVRTTGGKG